MSNALATVLQRIGVEEAPSDAKSSSKLMASVLTRPVWFVGLLFATASFLLQALALSLGDLSTVQPVMVTELVFLMAVLGFWFRRPLGWGEWAGACTTAVGLGIFLSVGSPTGGTLRPSVNSWGMVLGAASFGTALSLFMTRFGSRSWRAAWFGVAGGILFALTAALLKVSSDYVAKQGIGHLFFHWQPYAVAVTGLIGLVLVQHALQSGSIAASQSALLIVNPIASILIGTLLFGDRLRTAGGRGVILAFGLVVMCVGLVVLAHSPLISSPEAEERLSGGRGPRLDLDVVDRVPS
jgi:drug/metabolite transporter (DMT)-like permease